MTITRIDCHFFRGQEAQPEQSSYVAINPHQNPGSMVMAGALAARDSIGSHVACKLALQHYVSSVLEHFERVSVSPPEPPSMNVAAGQAGAPLALLLLERAFKAANDSVYQFGHKLAAGGRLAASLLGLVVEDNVIAAGRVGVGNAYLSRDGEVFPFFEAPPLLTGQQVTDGYVGSQSLISVELASVAVKPCDVILVASEALDPFSERELYGVADDLGLVGRPGEPARVPSAFVCEQVVQALYPAPHELAFAMLAVVGPETIYLRNSPAQQPVASAG